MAPTVLLLTHSGDWFTIDRVVEAVAGRGGRPVRVDTDRFPTEIDLVMTGGPGPFRHRLVLPDAEVDLADVRAVWNRRLWTARLPEDLDEALRAGCARETMAHWVGFLGHLEHARHVNPRVAERTAEDKPRQLRAALQVGLPIPPTLVTSRPEEVRAFWHAHRGDVVTKMLTPYTVAMEGREGVHTSRVTEADLAELDGLRLCPMMFQAHVPKRREHRVAVVGDRCFVGAIDASTSVRGTVDWRLAEPGSAAWARGELPAAVEARLVALLRELGIVFGLVDLIETPAGEHVFLEVNPGGEWGMLEGELDLPIADAIAGVLLEAP